MNEHIDELLPFYINGTLPARERASIEAHLEDCLECRMGLAEWEKVAVAVSRTLENLPPLSPVVQANMRATPSFPEAVQTTANLIMAQLVYLREGWLGSTILTILLVGVLTSLVLSNAGRLWTLVPVFILVPLVAILVTSFLATSTDDPALEILAATPTRPGVLIYARLTLALGAITTLTMAGSLLIAGIGGVSLAWYVAAWLGPVLWLSALTTLLALLLNPWTAAGVTTSLWGAVILLLFTEQAGAPVLGFSLTPLLYPSGLVFGGQVFLAGILWLANWLWLAVGTPPSLRLERGRGSL